MRNIAFLLILLSSQISAQTGINIIEGPLHQMACDSQCLTLHASFPKTKKTNTYTSSTIAYNPTSISGTSLNLGDDKFSNAIPLGFNFCFYENTYSHCYIADNGALTFESSYAGGNCFNNTQQPLPYFNSTCPDNAIFFMFVDLAPPMGGSIQYATTGTAPNRKFIVQYTNMKIFGANCSNTTSTFQVVLFELSNNIEIHVANKSICNSSTNNQKNYATIGVQNIGATSFHTISGKNAGIFTCSNEAYRIQPNGPNNYSITWKNAANTTIASNVDSIIFCPPYYPYSKVTASITYACPNYNTYSDTISFKKNQPIPTAITAPPQCTSPTGSITLGSTGPNSPFTFSFNGSAFSTTNVFTGLAAGSYLCKVKDVNGCSKDTMVNLQPVNNMAIVLDSIHQPGCVDVTGYAWVHAINGHPSYSYQWSNGQVGPVLGAVAQGTYTVIVTDAFGCTKTAPIVVNPLNTLVLSSTIVKPVCGNSNGSISTFVSGGTPGYSYLWNTNVTSSGLNNLISGTYSLTVTDAAGCIKTGIYHLSDTLYVQSANYLTQPSCGLNNGIITTYTYGGLPPYSYSWQPGNQTTVSLNNVSPGTYTCTVTASNGCSKVMSFTLNPSVGIVNVISAANANCDSSNGKIYLLNVLNYTTGYKIEWSTGDTSHSISNLSPGIYWVKATDSLGCSDVDTIVIQNDGKPKLNIMAYTPPVCHGDSTGSATFSGSHGVSPYKFSLDSMQFSSTATMNNIPGGTYVVYITDANSCLNDTLVTFPQPNKIVLHNITDTLVCYEDQTATITLSADNGFAPYQFAFEDTLFTTQNTFHNQSIGWHTVSVKDAHQCVITDSVEVIGPATPLHIDMTKEDIPCRQNNTGSFTIDINGGWPPYAYTWNNAFTGLQHDSLGMVDAFLFVSDAKGCKADKEVLIRQLYCCQLYFPNAFSPNRDGINDYFKPITVDDILTLNLKIFNRFGNLVYQSQSLNDTGWDGSDADVGTYFFLAEYTCPSQKEKQWLKGDITLLR